MSDSAASFRKRLKLSGLSDSAISAAWPEWWSESADASASAQAELRFTVARKLGLDPRSLLEKDGPRFTWDDSAKYKGYKGSERERPVLSSFGKAVSRLLVTGCPTHHPILGQSALELRQSILARGEPFITLQHLVALLWGVGIPVIHLRVHPLPAKRMCAMSVRVGERFAVLLARDASYPAPAAFHLAHEIGHIALGHVADGSAVIDMVDASERGTTDDPEESSADQFALELLTGHPQPQIQVDGTGHSPRELAQQANAIGNSLRIEPGALALCYAYSTGDWATAHKALSRIYNSKNDVWRYINRVANSQLRWDLMTDGNSSYIHALLGGTP